MTENIYTVLGSHVVLHPKDSSFTCGITNNGRNIPSQCRNLRLQLRYFTIQACPEDVQNYVSTNNLEMNTSCKDLNKSANIMSDDRVVIEINSCDSFRSCKSFTSIKEPSESGENEKNVHEFDQKKSEEEFNDQITMINAIFLNRKPPNNNQFEIKNENFFNKNNTLDVSVVDKKCNIESDKSSGDKTQACKRFSSQRQTENVDVLQSGVGEDKKHSCCRTELLLHDRSFSKTLFKHFKINRKIIYGTKKPLMSKIVGRKGHQAMLNKFQSLKSLEEKFERANVPNYEMQCFTEDTDQLYKGILLKIKHAVSEGYEIHFFESIQCTNDSLALYCEDTQENLNVDEMQTDHLALQHKSSNYFDRTDSYESSLLKLHYQPHISNSSINKSQEEFEETQKIDSDTFSCREELIDPTSQNNLIHFESTKSEISDHLKQSEQKNFTILYESEPKFSDLSLNDTFEIFFKNEDSWREQTENVLVNSVNCKETLSEENDKPGEEWIKKGSEEKIDIDPDRIAGILNTTANTLNTYSKRRRSALKSSLPVIEESPEPTYDLLENDYCLVDTLGRPIHLFDRRGFPLTDGWGRPLRTNKGDLLLKCDENGVPVVDEETLIFDMYGRQPHEEGFQPWMFPQNSTANRLTLGDGCPLVLFDIEGKPLTSVSGTLLVDSLGRSLLKLSNC